MNVDFLVKTWERIEVSETIQDEVLGKIKSGEITCSNDICDNYPDTEWEFKSESLIEYTEQVSLEDNGGCATIDVFDDEGNDIYSNETDIF
jgi:hypothetical protein